MNIEKMYVIPEGSDVARIYEWKENHLTMEELISFVASRGKIPAGTWLNRPGRPLDRPENDHASI